MEIRPDPKRIANRESWFRKAVDKAPLGPRWPRPDTRLRHEFHIPRMGRSCRCISPTEYYDAPVPLEVAAPLCLVSNLSCELRISPGPLDSSPKFFPSYRDKSAVLVPPRGPSFGGRTAHGRLNNSERDVVVPRQIPCKEICDR